MPRRNREGKIEGQPIIELQTDREIKDIHIGIGGERFEIWKKTEKPMMCKKCLQFEHPMKYCTRNESYCNICAEPINETHAEENTAFTAIKNTKQETNKNVKNTRKKWNF